MDLKKCIICGSQDLSMSMNFIIDNEDHKVYLCEQHEDTSPKDAKQALLAKLKEVEDFIKKAKEMGLQVVESTTNGIAVVQEKNVEKVNDVNYECDCGKNFKTEKGLVLHQKKCKVYQKVMEKLSQYRHQQPQQQSGKSYIPRGLKEGQKIIPVENAIGGSKSISGMAQGGGINASLESHNSLDIEGITNNIIKSLNESGASISKPQEVISDVQEISDRTGMGATIPKVIQGNTGTTHIKINKFSDAQLQQKFKDMAKQTVNGDGTVHWKYGENPITCPMCRGRGVTMNKKCPKCDGAGFID